MSKIEIISLIPSRTCVKSYPISYGYLDLIVTATILALRRERLETFLNTTKPKLFDKLHLQPRWDGLPAYNKESGSLLCLPVCSMSGTRGTV